VSELAVLVVGLVLCFAGGRSLRLTVLVAGFGVCWLLADALGATIATTFVVAALGAIALLVLSIVMSRFVIFVVGAAVGAVIGARLFALLGGDDPSWLLAVLFVPTFGFVAGFLAQRMGSGFLRWATAIAGSALILSAVGTMFSEDLGLLQTPDDPVQSAVHTVVWVALAIVGHQVQRAQARGK
jgi:hypothetical protein